MVNRQSSKATTAVARVFTYRHHGASRLSTWTPDNLQPGSHPLQIRHVKELLDRPARLVRRALLPIYCKVRNKAELAK